MKSTIAAGITIIALATVPAAGQAPAPAAQAKASGTAKNTQPKAMSLSQPRAALISLRSIKTPATR